MKLPFVSESPKMTREFGRRIGAICENGDWIGLTGELGAGKTCLVRGIARGMEVPKGIPVTSPTFVILQTYPGRMPLHHFDLYRLRQPEELADMGYQDLIGGGGVCVVEWCEQVKGAVPEHGLVLKVEIVDENRRRICIADKTKYNNKIYEKYKIIL